MSSYQINKFFMIVASIAIIYPYFQLFGNFRGIQPYVSVALIIALFFSLLLNTDHRPRYYIFFIPLIFILLNFILNGKLDFLFTRNLFSYLNFCLVFFIFDIYFQKYKFPRKLFYYSIYLWVIAGVMQLIFGEKIFSDLILSSTTSSRGATSFSTEPSFFGLQLCLLLTILYLNDESFKTGNFIILGFIGLILSMSFIAAYFYLLSYSVALIARRELKPRYLIFSLIGILLTIIILIDQRFGDIITGIYKVGFLDYIQSDSSGSKRFFGALTPFILSYNNFFFPLIDPIQAINDFNCNICRNDMKLSSYLGSFLFHYGYLFILIFIFLFLKQKSIRNVFVMLLLSLLLLVEIPIAHPLVPLLILSLFKRKLLIE
tara:strand:+ start:8463 stop:9584 length:1122 start_codon:yes stop_codon:yes gene_type:complete